MNPGSPHGAGTRSTVRASERGAALFVVMMVVTVLTAVGVVAAHRSSLVMSASGYGRQANQTRRLAELAGRVMASELGGGNAGAYLRSLSQASNTEDCPSNRGATAVAGFSPTPCFLMDNAALNGRVASQGLEGSLLVDPVASAPGSLEPLGLDAAGPTLEGSVMIEMLERNSVEVTAGEDAAASELATVEFTVTSWAQIRGTSAAGGPWCGTTASSQGSSVQAIRGVISVPNVPVAMSK